MTPKEKANELGNSMYNGSIFDYDKQGHLKEIVNAKRCALIAVDEIISLLSKDLNHLVNYWFEVKQEIEKL
jgi:hypothetical protein